MVIQTHDNPYILLAAAVLRTARLDATGQITYVQEGGRREFYEWDARNFLNDKEAVRFWVELAGGNFESIYPLLLEGIQ